MNSIRADIALVHPDIERDAKAAHAWFARPEGKQTLLSMGNAIHEIEESTIDTEKATIADFIQLENNNQQITRSILVNGTTIGFVWIELFENHGVAAPSLHIMIGDPDYRGKGIGKAVMVSAINFVRDVLKSRVIHSRHLVENQAVARLNVSLGFYKNGAVYEDENQLSWQNIKLDLAG